MGRTKRRRCRKRNKIIVNNLNCELPIIELRKWMKKFGWCNDTSLQIASFPSTGRGVMSSKKFNVDDTLIEIPFELMISFIVLEKSEFLQSITAYAKNSTIHDLLSLYLIFEFHLEKNSCWYNYIKSLPTMNTIRVIWLCSNDELVYINKELLDFVTEERTNFEQSWSRVQPLSKSQYTCQHCGARADTLLTRAFYLWAYVLVNTRAVYVDPSKIRQLVQTELINKLSDEPSMALCPFLDMFNHSSGINTTATLNRVHGVLKYSLITSTKFNKYEQVFISYGAHSNEKLLCQYGFVLSKNENDKVKFSIKEILSVLKIVASNRQYKFLCERQFMKDIFIEYNGCSFNMTAVLYVLSCAEENDWTVRIYTSEYTSGQLRTMYRLAKVLLEWKLLKYKKYFGHVSNLTGNSRHFDLYISYMDTRICFIENILEYIIIKYEL